MMWLRRGAGEDFPPRDPQAQHGCCAMRGAWCFPLLLTPASSSITLELQ